MNSKEEGKKQREKEQREGEQVRRKRRFQGRRGIIAAHSCSPPRGNRERGRGKGGEKKKKAIWPSK